ncbi:MAG: nucleotidyltransferase family protein [Hyphomicrobiales bacterium]
MIPLEDQLRAMVMAAKGRPEALRAVRSLALPQGAIGAGYIRAAVWDSLSGQGNSEVDDIDVIYFDPATASPEADEMQEARLRGIVPQLNWSVRNQARMHRRNGDRPYTSVEDAMRHWLETPTCVAVSLDAAGHLHVIAPYGLDDLFGMRIRPTPRGRERKAAYLGRLQAKSWCSSWPGVTVLDE